MMMSMIYRLLLVIVALSVLGCHSVTVKDVRWVAQDGFTVFASEYVHDADTLKSADTVIILPPTGGTTRIERNYARRLCQRGQHVFIVEDWTGLDETSTDLEIHNRLFSYANRAVGITIEHATGEIKLLGTSLGGLYGLSAVSRFPQIRRAVLIVSGYPFTEVIAHSEFPSMKELREKREKLFGFADQTAYEKKLSSVFKWNDPENIRSPELDRTKIFLFQALQDEVVPTSAQKNLEQRLPKAKVVKLNHGHLWTIIGTFLSHADEVLDDLTVEKEPGAKTGAR